uniref:Reverse transcriptase domain-containing protein n=1 Tax=Cannabis sativa TaxID=3483 RepID=A0A803Q2A7_CANSA
MSKAYDRVQWGFRHAMLKNFSEHRIQLVMCCVRSVSYNILLGGKEMGLIMPRRGLRQGDPLSPYLFLLCAEGLSALISDYERRGKIKGCKVARGALVISHIFFVDDSYLYCRATEEEGQNVMELLQCFQIASGQQVNLNKSSVFFSANTGVDVRTRIWSTLRVQEAELGSNSSFVWRSIFETRKLVQVGAHRRVGNGSQISISLNPWLPCDENPRISTNHLAFLRQNVAALMVTDNLAWDVDLVRDLFNDRDAQLILSIPLSSSRTENVKDLLWRTASNCLPTKVQLRFKHVNIDSNYPLCTSNCETILHRLVECPFARSCWERTGIGVSIHVAGTFTGWLESCFRLFDGEQRKIIAMTCCATRKVRNDYVWKKRNVNVASVTLLAKGMLEQWSKAQDKFHVSTATFLIAEMWRKPGAWEIKINVDAALFLGADTYNFMCVPRDASGQVLEAISCCK